MQFVRACEAPRHIDGYQTQSCHGVRERTLHWYRGIVQQMPRTRHHERVEEAHAIQPAKYFAHR